MVMVLLFMMFGVAQGRGYGFPAANATFGQELMVSWSANHILYFYISFSILVWLDSDSNITPYFQITPTSIQCDNAQQKLDSLPPPFRWAEVDLIS